MSNAIILYSPDSTGRPDEEDSVIEKDSVLHSLTRLGYQVTPIACHSHNLIELIKTLNQSQPDVIFNLVEALDGKGKLIHVVPFILDNLHLSYTGSPAQAIYWTSNKLASKQILRTHHLPTPDWIELGKFTLRTMTPGRRFIIKSIWEHASFGLDESSIIDFKNEKETKDKIVQKFEIFGGDCFAEAFIDGREFNISIVEKDGKPTVLPAAEMDFIGFEDKPAILTYSAKWDTESFEYNHTQRRFSCSEQDEVLLKELERLSLACWEVFHLKGYARVDFRVDENGKPFILEINVNPCISPDAGFVAACKQIGLDYDDVVSNIIQTPVSPAEQQQINWMKLLPRKRASTRVPRQAMRR